MASIGDSTNDAARITPDWNAAVSTEHVTNVPELARRWLADPSIEATISRLADYYAPTPYWRCGNDTIDPKLLGKVLGAFLDSGDRDQARRVLEERLLTGDEYENACDELMGDPEFVRLLEAATTGTDIDPDDLAEIVRPIVHDRIPPIEDDPLDYLNSHDQIEIAILPALPTGLSIEDEMLDRVRSSEAFGPINVQPNSAFANTLRTINVSSSEYIEQVWRRYRVRLRRASAFRELTGNEEWSRELAARWRKIRVRKRPSRAQLLSFDELFEIMENASYGGQFAIAAYAPVNAMIEADWSKPVDLTGTVQIGIVDYLWGSGHTITHRGHLTIPGNIDHVHVAKHVGYTVDERCGFVRDYFRVDGIAAAKHDRPHDHIQRW